MDKSNLIFLAIPIFFLLVFIEFLYGVLTKKNNYRLNDTFMSIGLGIVSRFIPILNLGFQAATFTLIANSFNLKIMPINSWITIILAFVLYDLCYYWMHRMHHEYKFLWGTHVVHHHGEEFNLSTAMRQTSTGFLWKWIFFLPMIIIGIPVQVFVAVGGLNLIYQFWVHTEHIPKLGWMEKIFITPSNHRIHHAKNKEYIDANYGGVFILWDRIFGTYIEERDNLKPVYGTVKPIRSWNPVWANIEIFSQMAKDSFYTQNWKDKLRVWISKTSWRPNDVAVLFPSNPENIDLKDKYNPEMNKIHTWFSWIQLAALLPLFGVIFITLSNQTYMETFIFGFLLLTITTSTSIVMMNNKIGLWLEFLRSSFVIFVLMGTELVSNTLLISQLFILHSLINILFVGATKVSSINLKTLQT
jgi:alkylglycerol monooxygenase|tara:strand:- start:620 stop:1864 length:1245 start_codon:yes stop_codon:yes gene_type:complete